MTHDEIINNHCGWASGSMKVHIKEAMQQARLNTLREYRNELSAIIPSSELAIIDSYVGKRLSDFSEAIKEGEAKPIGIKKSCHNCRYEHLEPFREPCDTCIDSESNRIYFEPKPTKEGGEG